MNKYTRIVVNFLFLSLLLFLFNCTPSKKLVYLQDKSTKKGKIDSIYAISAKPFVIKPGCNLYIKIVSLDSKSMDYSVSQQQGAGSSEQYSFLTSYPVDDSGYVELPIAGNINVSNLTIDETKDKIQNTISQYIKNATVLVKLTNFRISVLGEVLRPGSFYVYDNNINIFQALGLAGDRAEYGNSRKIKLIRTENNIPVIYNLDLTDKNILYSDKFFLMPNDVIYVEPNKTSKTTGIASVPWNLFISAISIATSVITLFILISR